MDEIKIITGEDYSNFFPEVIPISLENENIDNREYTEVMYSLYYNWLLKYLCQELNLKKYDNLLLNSELRFKTVSLENMDIYQYLSFNDLKYFYVRNNLYLDNLSNEEINILINYSINHDYDYNEEKKNFVKSTYQKVIFDDILGDNSVISINYGPESESFFAPNNAVVIGLRYDELYNIGMTDDEWDELHDLQIDELINIMSLFNEETKNKLSAPHQIIMYNDFSIKKKITNSEIISRNK